MQDHEKQELSNPKRIFVVRVCPSLFSMDEVFLEEDGVQIVPSSQLPTPGIPAPCVCVCRAHGWLK